MGWERNSGHEEFQDSAAQALAEYQALARDIMKTLPPEDWPVWVKNLAKPPDPRLVGDPRVQDMPGTTTLPESWGKRQKNLPVFNGSWNPFKRTSKVAQSPAIYSEDDPLDMGVVEEMVNDLHSEWWLETPERQRQAIANAFRAALVSPRQNLYWNSVVYQHLMEIPPEESDPDVFEQLIRKKKGKWDQFGQQTIDQITQTSDDPELINHVQNGGVSKYMPGIWGNIRNCALIGPYIEQLRQAALADIAQGGDGNLFRQLLLEMNINGIGPKIAAFVWLLLCPKTSRLATIDIHMMRHLGEQAESPKDYSAYRNFERKLDQQRKDMGYPDVPLGAFQWALWDRQRTPGYHQDHTPLRPLDPVDYNNIDWAPQARTRKTPLVEVSPDQQSLFDDQQPQQEAPPDEGWKII